MLGIIYILLSFSLGWAVCTCAFPGLEHRVETDYMGRKVAVSPYLLLLPAWYITGTLALTWTTYGLAYLFRGREEPLLYANSIALPLALLATAYVYLRKKRLAGGLGLTAQGTGGKAFRLELLYVAAVVLLANLLMWVTFFVKGEQLYVGLSVFSDFSPHIGMIRSFSYGNNFPTAYPHYGGEDIKYHFMFQFLAGNLEYLGLRIDYAFNLPSIISFISAFFLLYLLAVKITGRLWGGVLAGLFFAFRSSKTLFLYLADVAQGTGIREALSENTEFISSTPNENWGLWNLNVYCNQRHLAFGLAAIFLILLLFLPHLYETFQGLWEDGRDGAKKTKGRRAAKRSDSPRSIIKRIFFTRESWEVGEVRTPIASGLLLGSLSFFHGAAVIALLSILFIMAVVSRRRLEYLITALLAVALSFLQTKLFIHGSAVETQFLFGFIAENKTIFGVLSYLDRLLGILPWVLLAALCLERGANRYLLAAFAAPLVFAFTVSLTVDVTVNHKYIMISCILLGILAAAVVIKLMERKEFFCGAVGAVLILLLTGTGIYDLTVVLKKNTPETAIVLDLNHELTRWVEAHSNSQDLFLTSNYSLNQVVLGGAMLYEGWPYYAWSAGYDTDYRAAQVKLMYEADTPSVLKALAEDNGIRFIIVDRDNRNSMDYIVNEDTIRETYECVYSEGEGEWRTAIYDTRKPLR
ncbi:hypothetical protein HNQ56_004186 [Anaerotaenia torta]|uniref:hypothetical protein n=1 Tax=Anaerotaenia torta TaxID=433293 RepID=UPI003D1C9463